MFCSLPSYVLCSVRKPNEADVAKALDTPLRFFTFSVPSIPPNTYAATSTSTLVHPDNVTAVE